MLAERLFIDQADIDNSPEQFNGFSSSTNSYMPGDIKYTDINNDGVVNELDRVPIGKPTGMDTRVGYPNEHLAGDTWNVILVDIHQNVLTAMLH